MANLFGEVLHVRNNCFKIRLGFSARPVYAMVSQHLKGCAEQEQAAGGWQADGTVCLRNDAG